MIRLSRRAIIHRGALLAASASLLPSLSFLSRPASAAPIATSNGNTAQRIGIVGAGHVGGTLGRLWAQAGHQVLFSSRHPEELQGLVKDAGPNARAGMPQDAAAFGDVVLLAVPYRALPTLGSDLSATLKGKILLDACNPFADRDGDLGARALREGAGITTARLFPGARVVRGFSSISAKIVAADAHKTPVIGVPLAGDDRNALDVVSGLVRDIGFEPVVMGGLAAASQFQPGGPLWLQTLSATDLRKRVTAF